MQKDEIESFYRKLAPKVTNYLVAGGTSYAVACDIVQETFLKLWKMRDDLEVDESRISGLVHTIARNLRTDRLRHEKFMTYREQIAEDELVSEGEAPASDDGDYLKARLKSALDALPPLLREAFVLFQVSELSIRDISLQLGISESLVKVRVYRAKEKLKALLSRSILVVGIFFASFAGMAKVQKGLSTISAISAEPIISATFAMSLKARDCGG